jgi:ketosteroid isomerase-like protein
MTSTASERSLQARSASFTRWAREADPKAATAPARAGFHARFERELDAMGVTDPAERLRRGKALKKAYFADLARRSAKTRREAVEARKGVQAEAA